MIRPYALVGVLVVVGGTALIAPWLDPPGRRGVALAGAVAYGAQVVAFWLIARFGRPIRGFVWAWAGGMVLRLVVLAATAALVIVGEAFPPAPTLLGLVGFLFALLVTEFFFVRPDGFGATRRT